MEFSEELKERMKSFAQGFNGDFKEKFISIVVDAALEGRAEGVRVSVEKARAVFAQNIRMLLS